MNFNSFDFLLFFGFVWLTYIFLTRKAQNIFLLATSLFFYGYANLSFLGLIISSILVGYFCSLKIQHKKSSFPLLYLTISIFYNLFILFTFKSFHFFTEDFQKIFSKLFNVNYSDGLEYIIPIGLSFYTFQMIGYLIDVYKGEREAETSLTSFSLFIVFFPQLVAGPIERSKHLLPQINSERELSFEKLVNGFGLIVFGYFQKTVVADNLAPFYRDLFNTPGPENSIVTVLTLYVGVIRVYCDFAGYSNIAIGTAKLLGFNLSKNFYNPFFTSNPVQLWRRWHITLVQWFTRYIFKPLTKGLMSFSSYRLAASLSLLITTTAIGAWHGFTLSFFLWGFLNGLVYLLYKYINTNFYFHKRIPRFISMFMWVHIWGSIGFLYAVPRFADIPLHWENLTRGLGPVPQDLYLTLIFFSVPLFIIEWLHEKNNHDFFFVGSHPFFRVAMTLILFIFIFFCGSTNKSNFVYLQF